jgi:hypothetical protein
MLGKKHSEETKKKLSLVPWPTGSAHPNWGKHHSEEVKRKISSSKTGKSSNRKNFHHSEETKNRLSLVLRPSGENHPMFGKRHSEESKIKMSESRKGQSTGKNHPNWNGGSSFEPYSLEWTKELKEFIKNRDNNECQNPYCEHKSKRLHIHHIDYDKKNSSQFNLITLCNSCHPKTNKNRLLWSRFYTKIVWGKYL